MAGRFGKGQLLGQRPAWMPHESVGGDHRPFDQSRVFQIASSKMLLPE